MDLIHELLLRFEALGTQGGFVVLFRDYLGRGETH